METIATSSRQTKYVQAVLDSLQDLHHATNLELWRIVRNTYPEVSTTTIHRVSKRLKERGTIGCAPKLADGSERYDVNPRPHHHFMCIKCDRTCDVPDTLEIQKITDRLKNISRECALAGPLTMQGICQKCIHIRR